MRDPPRKTVPLLLAFFHNRHQNPQQIPLQVQPCPLQDPVRFHGNKDRLHAGLLGHERGLCRRSQRRIAHPDRHVRVLTRRLRVSGNCRGSRLRTHWARKIRPGSGKPTNGVSGLQHTVGIKRSLCPIPHLSLVCAYLVCRESQQWNQKGKVVQSRKAFAQSLPQGLIQ